MEIVDHRFEDVIWVPSPNRSGLLREPSAACMHFTAGRGFAQSLRWLRSSASGSSAHLLIGRMQGELAQLVAFNRIAWHAGPSAWKGRAKCNRFMLGIELDNAGQLELIKGQPFKWFDVATDKRTGQRVARVSAWPVRDEEVFEHVSQHGVTYWHRYSEPQLERLDRVLPALASAYPTLRELVGHEHIAPERKVDPGPAFPWARYAGVFDAAAA